MVTRNLQRELENENEHLHDGKIRRRRLAALPDWYKPAVSPVTIRVLQQKAGPAPSDDLNHLPRFPVQLLKEAAKETKQEVMKPKPGWKWTAYYKNLEEWRTVSYYVGVFTSSLIDGWNYPAALRRCELDYEGEIDPVEA